MEFLHANGFTSKLWIPYSSSSHVSILIGLQEIHWKRQTLIKAPKTLVRIHQAHSTQQVLLARALSLSLFFAIDNPGWSIDRSFAACSGCRCNEKGCPRSWDWWGGTPLALLWFVHLCRRHQEQPAALLFCYSCNRSWGSHCPSTIICCTPSVRTTKVQRQRRRRLLV